MARWLWIIAVMMMLAPAARAQFEGGSWELTLAGAGSSDKDFENDAIGVNAGLGYFFTDWLELSGRQTISYTRFQGSSAADLSTIFALDLHLALGAERRIVPFIGGNAGFFYGDTVTDSFEYGPEAGVKIFMNSTTFIFFRVEYQIYANDITGGFSTNSADQQFVYSLGIGLRF